MLVRPPCANIDQMFLVTSICNPSPNLLVLDKMIAVAEDQEMEPILVISKTDLQSADELEQIYQKAGIQVITVSSVSGQGIAQIKMLLKDKISVFTLSFSISQYKHLKLEDSPVILCSPVITTIPFRPLPRTSSKLAFDLLFELPSQAFLTFQPYAGHSVVAENHPRE